MEYVLHILLFHETTMKVIMLGITTASISAARLLQRSLLKIILDRLSNIQYYEHHCQICSYLNKEMILLSNNSTYDEFLVTITICFFHMTLFAVTPAVMAPSCVEQAISARISLTFSNPK